MDRATAAPRRVLAAAAVAGLVGALTLWSTAAGIGLLLTGLAVLAAGLGTGRRWPAPAQAATAVAAAGLLAVGAVRSAGWLVALCLLSAWAVGALALVGGRTWTGLLFGVLAPVFVPVRTVGWTVRGLARATAGRAGSMARLLAVAAVTAALAVVFAALLASADAAFAQLLDRVVPSLSVASMLGRAVLFGAVATAALGAACLAHLPPRFDQLAPGPGRPLRRWEWAVPVVVLDLLFLAFVLVQLAVLFGGRQHVLDTGGLTYAEYARQGFWQLLLVTALTLGVVAVATRKAGRETRADRILVRLLLGVLCGLSLVIVASALRRLWLYEEAFGFTRLRVWVHTVELWLGLVFVLVIAAGVRLRAGWLPRAVVGTGVAALLGLAAVNPDAFIAERNVERYERTGRIDVDYLAGLSADAVPALDRLPEPERSCALRRLADDLPDGDDEPWYAYNHARVRARAVLAAHPVDRTADCR